MKKLLLVYNPRSSQSQRIRLDVLEKVRNLRGWTVGKFEARPLSVDENAELLARLVDDGDLVLAVGGDGTATMAANGVLLSEKKAVFGVLGYGNFNDMDLMLNGGKKVEFEDLIKAFEGDKVAEIYPLEVVVDERHWRYAVCYVTLGLFAESTTVFDEKKIREKLQKKQKHVLFSLRTLFGWFVKNRKRRFLASGELNGEKWSDVTDYLAVNSGTVAKILKTEGWFRDKNKFGSGLRNLRSYRQMCAFMMKGMTKKLILEESDGDILEFTDKTDVEIQAEGEYQRLEGVKKVEIRKNGAKLRVLEAGNK